jgi:hypothetical protein
VDEDLDMPTKQTGARPLCRRTLLIAAATIAGAGRVSAARGKRSQAEVAYQDHPNGVERCEICAPFLPPDQCRVVVGPVSRQGWCKVYVGADSP